MEIRVFESDTGDCILIESVGGTRILCDGGMAKSMRDNVAPHLRGLDIDLVHVSHVDQDHIAGVLQLLENGTEWLVYDRHMENQDPIRKPRVPRPPKIARIWNNSFREQVSANRGDIEDLLAHTASMLQASQRPDLMDIGRGAERIESSIRQALKLSRLIQPELLGVPINEIPGQRRSPRLIMRRSNQRPVRIGDFKVTILGPSQDEIEDLRRGWNNWLRTNRDVRRELDRYVRGRFEAIESDEVDPFDLRDWNDIPDFRGVTVPNVASIVLLIEADGARVLVTGDVQQDILLRHLEESGLVDERGSLHVDILKIPHHGSHHNADENFCRRVSADHYLFTGIDGRNTNPEISVIDMYWNARLGKPEVRAKAPEANRRPFTFYFSSHSSKKRGATRKHMQRIQQRVRTLHGQGSGQMQYQFNQKDYLRIDL